jgi:hypothetical protein
MKINRDFEQNSYVKTISGKEFKESGMLWFVNSILHTFGMALTWDPSTDVLEPVITKFRGFEEKYNDQGYRAITEYMRDNAQNLIPDVTEEIEI